MEPLRRVRDKLRGDHADHDDDSAHDSVADGLTGNAVFNTKALPGHGDDEGPSKMQRVKEKVQKIAHATAHPRQAAQSKATNQFVVNERPWLDHQAEADEELLDAVDDLDEATGHEGQTPAIGQAGKPGVDEARNKVQNIRGEREELQAAWHLSRYVRRARVVRYPITLPPQSHYEVRDSNGRYQRFKWIKYAGHLVLYGLQSTSLHYVDPTNEVAYDRDVLIRNIERLLIASESFQLWWMRVRRVYSWTDPWLTFKWLLAYLVMLKTGYFMSCFWLYLLYSVVGNYSGKHTHTWMRESHTRANKTKERASTLSELIIRHGSDAWVEPFLDECGPWLQLQLCDLADILEISCSYYEWTSVSSTTASCVTFVVLFLVSAIPDYKYSMKIFWMAAGMYFFMCRPIATHYPRFRHVVDPIKWMFWNMPTDSEAAFDYLRKQALSSLQPQYDAVPFGDNDSYEDKEDEDLFFNCMSTPGAKPTSQGLDAGQRMAQQIIMTFAARWSGRRGRLQITRSFFRFVSDVHSTSSVIKSTNPAMNASPEWERPFTELLEVRKTTSPPSKVPVPFTNKGAGGAGLSILWASKDKLAAILTTEETPNDEEHCEEELLYGMDPDRRDEAFNALIGLSGALWMRLQPEAAWQDGIPAVGRLMAGGG